MKVESKIYKGIEFIQLDELPVNQKEELLKSFRSDFFIKIMIDGQIVSQCIQYKDYDAWYNNVYAFETARAVTEKRVSEVVIKPKLALNS